MMLFRAMLGDREIEGEHEDLGYFPDKDVFRSAWRFDGREVVTDTPRSHVEDCGRLSWEKRQESELSQLGINPETLRTEFDG